MPDYRPVEIDNPFGAPVLYVPETGSVLDDAADEAAGWRPGTVLYTGYQNRGRGRGSGRGWQAGADQGLLMALLLRATEYRRSPGSLSLRAALALARCLESLGLEPQIKWPNDLLLAGKKVSGILGEASGGWLRLGLGLNCLQRSFPPELAAVSTSILLAGGPAESPTWHLRRLLPFLRQALEEEGIRAETERRLYRLGGEMILLEGGTERPRRLRGTVAGVQEDGALLFHSAGETKTVYAGEFCLREESGP